MDLIICDTPDNCDVPDVKVGGRIEVPFWNMVKKSTFPAIFHVAEAVLADSGVLLLFVPAEEQAQLMSHPWASDWECLRTFYVVNHRPFSPKWVSPSSPHLHVTRLYFIFLCNCSTSIQSLKKEDPGVGDCLLYFLCNLNRSCLFYLSINWTSLNWTLRCSDKLPNCRKGSSRPRS